MSSDGTDVSRRTVLRSTAAGLGVLGASGVAGATPGGDRKYGYNVGFDTPGARRAAENAASEVIRTLDSIGVLTAKIPDDAVDALRNNPNVRFVEENRFMHKLAETTPWGIDRTDADVATASGDTGDGGDLVVIDTGVDSDHPDSEFTLGQGKAFVECGSGGFFGCVFSGNSNACNEPWDDDNDHGTHCAGSAAAVDDAYGVVGVAPDVTVHAAKALDCAGSGSYSDIAAAIEWTADQGYDVASMSLGGSSSSTVADAVSYAANNGVTMVAAAGNDGECTDCVGYPAAYPEVIAVSATSCDDTLASFSSTGPEVELAAPGDSVYSTVPGGYDTFSGTSMACPHVSGAAAVLAAQGNSRSEVRSTLNNSAEDIGLGDNEQGAGLLDAAAAVGLDSSDDGTGDGPNC
jgi:subtilisin